MSKNIIRLSLVALLAVGAIFAVACKKDTATTNEPNTPGTNDNGGQTEPSRTFTVNGVSFTMVRVEGGTFYMGAQDDDPNGPNYDANSYSNEWPAHMVTLGDYYIAETECTQALWMAVMGSNPSAMQDDPMNPVESMSFFETEDFLMRLSMLTGEDFRLPTEAEWEYAARGGKNSRGYKYSGSNNVDSVAWTATSALGFTHMVGELFPNELGLYDMSGNVLEVCSDFYGYYGSEPQTDPQGPSGGSMHVGRGGSWCADGYYARITNRNGTDPNGGSALGFRIAMSR